MLCRRLARLALACRFQGRGATAALMLCYSLRRMSRRIQCLTSLCHRVSRLYGHVLALRAGHRATLRSSDSLWLNDALVIHQTLRALLLGHDIATQNGKGSQHGDECDANQSFGCIIEEIHNMSFFDFCFFCFLRSHRGRLHECLPRRI